MRDLLHTQISVRIYDLNLCRGDWVIPILWNIFVLYSKRFSKTANTKKKLMTRKRVQSATRWQLWCTRDLGQWFEYLPSKKSFRKVWKILKFTTKYITFAYLKTLYRFRLNATCLCLIDSTLFFQQKKRFPLPGIEPW